MSDTRGINAEVITKDENGVVHCRSQLLVRKMDRKIYVARIGGLGTDWAAYKDLNNKSPFQVYDMGLKLSEREATEVFPRMAEKFTYRD